MMIVISPNPSQIPVGKLTEVILYFENISEGVCTNIQFTFQSPPPSGISFGRGTSKIEIERLDSKVPYEHKIYLRAQQEGKFILKSNSFSYKLPSGQSYHEAEKIKINLQAVTPTVMRTSSKKHSSELREQKLPFWLLNKIAEFLTSLPNVSDSYALRAFSYRVGLDEQIYNKLNFALPPAQFFPILVVELNKYGTLNDGRHALKAILETAKEDYSGQEKRSYCDILIGEVERFLDYNSRRIT